MLLALSLSSRAQLICVPDSQFTYPELARRAGISASFKVTFDIIGRSADNIHIESRDGREDAIDFFAPSIRSNLRKLFFRRDSTCVSLSIFYRISEPGRLSTLHAETTSDSEFCVIAPGSMGVVRIVDYTRTVDPNSDSTTISTDLCNSLPFKGGVPGKSDILVKRVFAGGSDSTIILRNNCVGYEAEILSAASKYTLEDFLQFAPKATYFFIRFRILHYSRECDCEELL